MSDSTGTITIKFDKKLVLLFIVIAAAIVTGLFVYNYAMKPATDLAIEKGTEAIATDKAKKDELSARRFLNIELRKKYPNMDPVALITPEQAIQLSRSAKWSEKVNSGLTEYEVIFFYDSYLGREGGGEALRRRIAVWLENGSWKYQLF